MIGLYHPVAKYYELIQGICETKHYLGYFNINPSFVNIMKKLTVKKAYIDRTSPHKYMIQLN